MKRLICHAIPLVALLGCSGALQRAAIGYTDHYLERFEAAAEKMDAGPGIDWTTVAGGVVIILTGLGVTAHQARDRRKFHNGGKSNG